MNSQNFDPYLRRQIEAKTAPAVIKLKLLNMRSNFPEGLIVAVEGPDDKVVLSYWIARMQPQLAYEFLVCGGKAQVRNLKNSIAKDRAGAGHQLCFVVDRDFNDLMGFDCNDAVFMMDRYSIENYLVCGIVLEKTLSVAFPCNGLPNVRNSICELFGEDYRRFLMASKELNFRIFAARQLGIDIDHLMPTSITDFVSVKIGQTQALEHDPESLLPFDWPVGPGEVEQLRLKFEALDPAHRYRGKFAFKFFHKWIGELCSEYRKPVLGLFGLQADDDSRIIHTELNMGGFAGKSTMPEGLDVTLAKAV